MIKGFKEFFVEKVRWEMSAINHVFRGHVPLTPKMMKRLIQNRERVKSLHISDFENFKKLEKLQGKKKSISTGFGFQSIPAKYLNGVWAGGGIVSVIEGYPLITKDFDSFTMPDKQGRRWIQLIRLADDPDIKNKFDYGIENIRLKVLGKYLDPVPSYTDADMVPKNISNKIIKDYIDEVEKFLKKNIDDVIYALYDYDYTLSSLERQMWSEFVLTEIKILKVYLMKDDRGLYGSGIEYKDEGYDKKYPTEIIDFAKFDEEKALK